jgi:hypothetical protein
MAPLTGTWPPAVTGLDVDHGAGVVVADDRQVSVRVAIADFIDPDPVEVF